MANNPLDEYLEEKDKVAANRQDIDLQYLEAWRKKPTTTTLAPLMQRFEPEVGRIASIQAGRRPRIKPESHKAFLRGHMIDAFNDYDLSKAVGFEGRVRSLKGHIEDRMRNRGQRWIGKMQNAAYISEQNSALITPIQKAREVLYDEFGKPPSNRQVADFLNKPINQADVPSRIRGKFTPNRVSRIDKMQISDIPSGGWERDPSQRQISREAESLSTLHHSLTPEELVVFRYDQQGLKPGQIARKLGKSGTYVSRQLGSIRTKYTQQAGLGLKQKR